MADGLFIKTPIGVVMLINIVSIEFKLHPKPVSLFIFSVRYLVIYLRKEILREFKESKSDSSKFLPLWN